MLVFNEGLPRSGKSYDVVKNHILPALAAGRKVFARLNGLDEPAKRQAIADYLKIDMVTLDDRLVHVTSAEVRTLFVAVKDAAGEWTIPDQLKDNLFVVDECHSFYVASREAINPAVEEFFALIGQNGGDGVLMSQWYRRLHSSLRARIERKNLFQKLTAVGMDGKYNVTRYHALGPERFEKIGAEVQTYEPVIFPMYKGYADGTGNRAVYKAGGQTVWHKIGKYAIFIVPVVLFGIYQLTHFFGRDSGLAKSSAPAAVQPVQPVQPLSGSAAMRDTARGSGVAAEKPRHGKMDDGQAYVFDLAGKARPRLAGLVTMPGEPARGVIEWRQDAGMIVDRLDLAQIRDLGVTVEVHSYGVRLVVGKDVQVVTAWPLDVPPSSTSDTEAAPPERQQVASTLEATSPRWPDRQIPTEYTPPQLVHGPGLSSYTGK